MKNDFRDLVERFGAPQIVIPNAPRIVYQGKIGMLAGTNPEINVDAQARVYHRRFRSGESDFLALRRYYTTWLGNEKLLLEHFVENDLKPVEFRYTYKNRRAWDYGTEKWKEARVSIAADRDAEPLSREDVRAAAAAKRLLWVCGWSSMGDGYVDFRILDADRLPTDDGYYFLFDETCRLDEKTLVGMGDGFERDEEFFDAYADHFTLPFLLDK